MKIALGVILLTFIGFIFYLSRIGARREHFATAALETVVVWVISNMPVGFLWWGALYGKEKGQLDEVLLGLFSGGEVFIYVSAIVAPVVWALMAYFKESHRVFTGLYLMALLIILPFSAFSFQQARLGDSANQSILDVSALMLYCVSIILWFGATVYTRFVESYQPAVAGNSVLNGLRGDR